jgi:[ribosomal protein S5]-alanine N-acetyltransferase
MPQQPSLATTRLILRPFMLSDAKNVQRLAGDRTIADTTNIPHPYPDGKAEEWIQKHPADFEAGQSVNFAITLGATGEFMGSISLMNIAAQHQRAELGYWLGVPYWRKGYCTEAGNAIIAYGFSTLALNRIYAFHAHRNPASGRVMQKLGMTHEGMLRQHAFRWERFEDLVVYGILRSEWEMLQ